MRDLFSFSSIRGKMIVTFLAITFVFGAINVYYHMNSKKGMERSSKIMNQYIYLNSLSEEITALETEVEKYLSSKASSALLNYYNMHNELSEKAKLIERSNSYDDHETMIKDIGFMIDEFLSQADKAINAKRARSSQEYNAYFARTYKISEYIRFYINELLNKELKTGAVEYNINDTRMKSVNIMNVFLMVGVTIFSIITAILFTYKITKPIIEMSDAADRISKGEYDIGEIDIDTHDELTTLASGFNNMVGNIKSHIEGIKRQVKTERRLKEQEMQNLKMKNLLKDAELKSLQSQINPHFLFNTLNAASQLSAIEGADRSSEFILKAAELFRYSLRKLNEPVTIKDEIDNVKAYMYILKTRFGDRIDFSVQCDQSVENQKIPCTIIQPIVENAYIHGLENIEYQGKIDVDVESVEDKIYITVRDNGEGMGEEEIHQIIQNISRENKKGHVTGIGTRNVIDRLKLFYSIDKSDEIISIFSEKGVGTEVILKIPKYGISKIEDYGEAKDD